MLFRGGPTRSALTPNFSDKYTTRCASSIQSGLRPTVIVRRANLTNRALLSCSDFLRRKRIGRSPSYRTTKTTKKFLGMNTENHPPWHLRRRYSLPLREAIPLWFAVSSPLTGLILGLLGAWFFTW